ncbi:hypothetical protein As57867_014490, partial [Aphanomyces stellatus]
MTFDNDFTSAELKGSQLSKASKASVSSICPQHEHFHTQPSPRLVPQEYHLGFTARLVNTLAQAQATVVVRSCMRVSMANKSLQIAHLILDPSTIPIVKTQGGNMGNDLTKWQRPVAKIAASQKDEAQDEARRRSSTSLAALKDLPKTLHEPPDIDRANQYQIWAFGTLIVMGGQFYGWNAAFSAGFVPFFVTQVFMGVAYIVYVACLSEIGSKVPGGSYGLNRAVLGLYPGFILGCLELLEYISMASVSVLYVANFITTTYNWDENLQPLIWLVFYVVFIAILNIPGRYLYSFLFVFNFVGILVPTLLFIVSALPHTDFAANAVVVDPDTNATTWAAGDIATS